MFDAPEASYLAPRIVHPLDPFGQTSRKSFIAQRNLLAHLAKRACDIMPQSLFDKFSILNSVFLVGFSGTELVKSKIFPNEWFLLTQSCVTAVAAPLIISQTCLSLLRTATAQGRAADWVQMQVTTEFQQIVALLNQKSLVAPPKDVADELVAAIEPNAVAGDQPMHPPADVWL